MRGLFVWERDINITPLRRRLCPPPLLLCYPASAVAMVPSRASVPLKLARPPLSFAPPYPLPSWTSLSCLPSPLRALSFLPSPRRRCNARIRLCPTALLNPRAQLHDGGEWGFLCNRLVALTEACALTDLGLVICCLANIFFDFL